MDIDTDDPIGKEVKSISLFGTNGKFCYLRSCFFLSGTSDTCVIDPVDSRNMCTKLFWNLTTGFREEDVYSIGIFLFIPVPH